jgi:hypothetical protein
MRMSQLGKLADIGQLGQRIGRGLQKQHSGVRPDGGLPAVQIGQLDERCVDTGTRQILTEQRYRAAEYIL